MFSVGQLSPKITKYLPETLGFSQCPSLQFEKYVDQTWRICVATVRVFDA